MLNHLKNTNGTPLGQDIGAHYGWSSDEDRRTSRDTVALLLHESRPIADYEAVYVANQIVADDELYCEFQSRAPHIRNEILALRELEQNVTPRAVLSKLAEANRETTIGVVRSLWEERSNV